MPLMGVTISGVDESVDPLDLLELSGAYDFVEWAMLVSARHTYASQGIARWPSMDWMARLVADAHYHPLTLAVHICGTWVEQIVAGETRMLATLRSEVSRVQLNFAGRVLENYDPARFVLGLTDMPQRPLIFQIGGPCAAQAWADAAETLPPGLSVPLFDDSHGTGICPQHWTVIRFLDPVPYQVGYAGGLSPANLAKQLPRIAAAAGPVPYWIDMESGVRSDDGQRLDLAKVRQVLEIARGWRAHEGQPMTMD